MSNFIAKAIHPRTGIVEVAEFLDDYFGKHHYGVRFADGATYSARNIISERTLVHSSVEVQKQQAADNIPSNADYSEESPK